MDAIDQKSSQSKEVHEWLLDSELWKAPENQEYNTTSSKVPTDTTTTTSAIAAGMGHVIHHDFINTAAEQHVHALHALQNSSITYQNNNSNNNNDEASNVRRKHWGTVALPLPLHIVTNTNATTTTNTVESSAARSSGEWKDLRSSFNKSYEEVSVPIITQPAYLSQRLMTEAKLFKPLANQWASGICYIYFCQSY